MTLPALSSNNKVSINLSNSLLNTSNSLSTSSSLASTDGRTSVAESENSNWNLFTLSEDRQSIVCSNRSPNIEKHGKSLQKIPAKLPSPPPTDDYDRVPLGPPVPIAPKKVLAAL